MAGAEGRSGRIRWWGALGIALVAAGLIGWVWSPAADRTGQDRVMLTLPIVVAAVIVLFVSLLAGLSARRRVMTIGGVILVVAAAAALLRVDGVTGDLVPIVSWRLADRSSSTSTLPASTASPTEGRELRPVDATASPDVPAPDVAPASEGEYPQFLGPARTGVVAAIDLETDWDAHPPRLLWRARTGEGWSGFAVARGLAITQEQRDGDELVAAYDLRSGALRWTHRDAARFESTIAGTGPRATPTIAADQVFTLGSTGILNALDVTSGRSLWRRDINKDGRATPPEWGRSGSPLVVGELVVVSSGGGSGRSLIAYRRDSGAVAWYGGSTPSSYSSPMLATLSGVEQVIVLNESDVSAHEPRSGRVLWSYPWPSRQVTVAQPLLLEGDRLLLSAGYGVGSKLLRVTRSAAGTLGATLEWESPRMKAKFTNLVVHDGFVYGLDDGVLVCLDPATGERRWKSGRYGHGQVVLAGDVLIVQTEEGEIVLVEPTPAEHREGARMRVFEEKTWNPPALAGSVLVVRNATDAAAYQLPTRR